MAKSNGGYDMNLGLLARAENIGLGNQTWEFFRHMQPQRTMVIDLSAMNKNRTFFGRFPGAYISRAVPRRVQCMNFIDANNFNSRLTHLFTCETPYNYEFFEQCRRRRVVSVLQYNWEFLDYLPHPRYPRPAILASPSYWHLEEAKQRFGAVYLPVPVNRDVLPFEKKTQFKNFLHLAGIRVDHDRNGTIETLMAFKVLEGRDIKLTVKCQNRAWVEEWKKEFNSSNVEIIAGDCENYWDNYSGYDCLIMPRKYGGLCLPMQEALSKGMPVIMTNTCPNDKVLPKEWLVDVDRTGDFEARCKIDIYTAKVANLAQKISDFADMNESEAGWESVKADTLAEQISWSNLLGTYKKILS